MKSEPAIEDWIRERWGGFTYLVIACNENFSLDFKGGQLWLHYENDGEYTADSVLLFETPTQQNVIDAERIFGIEIKCVD